MQVGLGFMGFASEMGYARPEECLKGGPVIVATTIRWPDDDGAITRPIIKRQVFDGLCNIGSVGPSETGDWRGLPAGLICPRGLRLRPVGVAK